jgi:CRISPR-associated protein Cas2
MQFVICYDLSDDQRRERMAAALLDFGKRIQESVFVADLDDTLAARMMERLQGLVDEAADTVHVFRLCKECRAETATLGLAVAPKEPAYYVI